MYLLDTHVFLWYLDGDARLSALAHTVIENGGSFLSMASLWEMTIKQKLGKLNYPGTLTQFVELCLSYEIKILPISVAHLERINNLPSIHKDPFDRLIIAQAKVENLTLLTRDDKISAYPIMTQW